MIMNTKTDCHIFDFSKSTLLRKVVLYNVPNAHIKGSSWNLSKMCNFIFWIDKLQLQCFMCENLRSAANNTP
jgi:hypothetical protein